jgi:hypothetical protein
MNLTLLIYTGKELPISTIRVINQANYETKDEDQNYPEPEVRSRLPSIFLAQQQPGFDNEAYLSVENSPCVVSHNRLSTITEPTERTEPSLMWRSRQQYLVLNSARSFQSSPTSYGRELGVSKFLFSPVTIHFFVR